MFVHITTSVQPKHSTIDLHMTHQLDQAVRSACRVAPTIGRLCGPFAYSLLK